MAAGSLLALLDDIATVLDDISILTKVAAKKTAGVLGDDLALNAEQVSGVRAEREIPVVWAVFKGSLLNKLILVPIALALSAFLPWLITPLLMIGGAYLCYEGFEKVWHKLFHKKEEHEHEKEIMEAVIDPNVDMVAFEKEKIKGAIRTDFILSAEIIVIALGTVKDQPFASQAGVVSLIALVMTVGVYGLVAGIVKMDDAGLALLRNKAESLWAGIKRAVGSALLAIAPKMMKLLSILGTIAMFLVGGGILVHGIPAVHHWVEHLAESAHHVAAIGNVLAAIAPVLLNGLFGIIAGGIIVALLSLGGKFRKVGEA